MYKNPNNLTRQEFLNKVNEEFPPGDQNGVVDYPKYIIFATEEHQRTGLYHHICRIHWDRDNVPMLSTDCSWPFNESPTWITTNE